MGKGGALPLRFQPLGRCRSDPTSGMKAGEHSYSPRRPGHPGKRCQPSPSDAPRVLPVRASRQVETAPVLKPFELRQSDAVSRLLFTLPWTNPHRIQMPGQHRGFSPVASALSLSAAEALWLQLPDFQAGEHLGRTWSVSVRRQLWPGMSRNLNETHLSREPGLETHARASAQLASQPLLKHHPSTVETRLQPKSCYFSAVL